MAGELGVRACVSLWELVLGLDSIVRLPLDARFTECATNEIAGKAKSEGKQRQAKASDASNSCLWQEPGDCGQSVRAESVRGFRREVGAWAGRLADEAGHHFSCILQLHLGIPCSTVAVTSRQEQLTFHIHRFVVHGPPAR